MLEKQTAPPTAPDPVERFAAHCAHDLNNLLTGILGHLELMQNRARRAGIGEFDPYIEGARQAAGRAAAFTQRLLVFSGHARCYPVPVAVNALIRDLAELLRQQGQIVGTDLAADAGAALCDQARLELALTELLANAREAGGEARVATHAAGAAVEITVTDTGAGMTPEILARCAEPFFTTRGGGAGKGLGLALVGKIVADAGGTISLSCAGGTTVRLRLPRTSLPTAV